MKNLKYLDEFINEAWNEEHKKLSKEDKLEYDKIYEMIEEYVEELSPGSFDFSYYSKDGDEDLKGLKSYLDEQSSIDNMLDYFFNKYRKVIYDDINFTAQNGFYDYVLYTYDKSYMLNGGGVGPEPVDKMYKYFYGFQTTKLGKIFIKQNFGTKENFYKECAKNFPEYFFEDVYSVSGYEDYTIVDNNVCIIDLSFINNVEKIEDELENLDKTPVYLIDNGILIVMFEDDELDVEDDILKYKEKHRDIIQMLKMKYTTSKYNL